MLTFIHVTALTFAASVTTVLTEQMPIKSSPEIGPSYTITYETNEQDTAESNNDDGGECNNNDITSRNCS